MKPRSTLFGGPGRRRSLGLVLVQCVSACAEQLPGRLPSRALGRRLGRDGHPPVWQVPSCAHPTGSASSDAPVRKVRLRSATAGGLEWKQHPRQCRFRFYLGCSQARRSERSGLELRVSLHFAPPRAGMSKSWRCPPCQKETQSQLLLFCRSQIAGPVPL